MDPDSWTPIVVLVFLLGLYAFFAAAKESIVSMRKSRRIQLIEEGNAAARLIDHLAEDATRLLATEQLFLKLISFSIVAFASFVYTAPLTQAISVSSFIAVILIVVITAVTTLFFGELIPKEVARSYAEPIALWLVYPFHLLSYPATPLARLVSTIGRLATGHWDEAENGFNGITEEDLRTYVDAGEEGGVLKEGEKEMIYSIFELDDTLAREVMVPRIDVVAIEANTPVMEALDIILEVGHSRVPVFMDSVDNVVGVLYAKDLLSHWREGGEARPVHGLEREVYFVPETKPVSELLRELQTKKVHIAIVVDEYGGTAGLVTIEDILEEIVGEIQDEHDPEEFFMQYISDDEYIFNARMDLDDINNVMSTTLPTDQADTLGGLVYNLLGRVPEVGDMVEVDGQHLTVLNVDGRRIGQVKVQRAKEDKDQDQKVSKTVSVDSGSSRQFVSNTSQNAVSGSP